MRKKHHNKTLFATSVLNAALDGAFGEMEDYLDDSQYIPVTLAKKSRKRQNGRITIITLPCLYRFAIKPQYC
ncbi:MAG: hypothetical protein COA45_05360 [Zetaproteobacteria bacterium]|nr:MAG: hypothetical protein COA45_05360 [Zetaproteobacteria bacterium]